MDAYNVTISHQPSSAKAACVVQQHGSGLAIDDVHDVLVACGDGRSTGDGGGQHGPHGQGGGGGHGGAIAAGLLVPCFLFAGCVAAASVAIGRRNGAGPREGFAILARGVRDLPRTMPPVQVPSFGRGGAAGAGAGDFGSTYFAGSGNDYAAGNHMSDPIPEAVVIDAATGLPAQPVRASVVSSYS